MNKERGYFYYSYILPFISIGKQWANIYKPKYATKFTDREEVVV